METPYLLLKIYIFLSSIALFFNSRCTCIAWIPNGDGSFVVSHADGNMYVYEKASFRLYFEMNMNK